MTGWRWRCEPRRPWPRPLTPLPSAAPASPAPPPASPTRYARLLRLDPAPLLEALEPAIGGDVPLRAHEIAGTLPEGTRRKLAWRDVPDYEG